MYEKQIAVWKSKLADLEEGTPEYERVAAHIERLKGHAELAALTEKDGAVSYTSGGQPSGDEFPARPYVQLLKAKCLAAYEGISVERAAERIYGKSLAGAILKAADPSSRADVAVGPAPQDFVRILKVAPVYDRLNFRRVRADIPIARQLTGTVGYWVGEGAKITESRWSVETLQLTPMKVGGIATLTLEAVRDGSLASDREVQRDLAEALRIRMDSTMLSSDGETTGTPAGLLNGVTPVVSAGSDAEDLVADLKGLRAAFPRELRGDIELLMDPDMAADIAGIRTELGERVFPSISVNGGTLEGYPVTVSTGVPARTLIALIPQEIYAIADSGVELAVSRDATIDGTSLFEHALIGVRAIRSVNWALRRPGVVQYIANAEYGPTASPTAS